MKVKKVNRYYCDFCKKANCCGAAMAKHEKRCTLNPNRVCGMCKMRGLNQKPINNLLAVLPWEPRFDLKEFDAFDKGLFHKAMQSALEELRRITDDCPACILSAIRQRGIPVPMVTGFNFTEECKAIWKEINDERAEEYA